MRRFVRKSLMLTVSIGVLAVGLGASLAAQYTMTVNKDRLINAQNEPQNWLMMNGDYGSTRYSKLSQINRENVKNLRMVWALALGGLQDVVCCLVRVSSAHRNERTKNVAGLPDIRVTLRHRTRRR